MRFKNKGGSDVLSGVCILSIAVLIIVIGVSLSESNPDGAPQVKYDHTIEPKDCPNCKKLEIANEELLHQYKALKAEWDRSRKLPEADGG